MPSRAPTSNEIFLAEQSAPETNKSTFTNAETAGMTADLSPVEVQHINAGRRRLWRLTKNGSVPTWVGGNSLATALKSGMSPTCHDCRGDHDGGINDCPGRAKRQYRPCPVCAKRLYDPQPTGAVDAPEAHDDMALDNADLGASNALTRTSMLLRRHMRAFHKDEALIYYGVVGKEDSDNE